MSVNIRSAAELGQSLQLLRKQQKVSATELARRSGRSRDLIWRLESGRDVSTSALLDVLRALGSAVNLAPVALPTLDEMRERFGEAD